MWAGAEFGVWMCKRAEAVLCAPALLRAVFSCCVALLGFTWCDGG
ncbi:hypothetical protein JOE56_001304 [Brevibacterium paucivorans]|uniref:Uncharacterized protein n=1 Tax=Brevibacterium paucivorans TaxID=170994 RepID=A0ABS2SLG6_9MICO|nr:hypothetical protein [Brevibacterium paucivorans]